MRLHTGSWSIVLGHSRCPLLGEASGYIFLKHGKENEAAKFPSLVRDHMCPAVGCTSAARQEVGKLEEKAVLFTLHFPTVLTTLKKYFIILFFQMAVSTSQSLHL